MGMIAAFADARKAVRGGELPRWLAQVRPQPRCDVALGLVARLPRTAVGSAAARFVSIMIQSGSNPFFVVGDYGARPEPV
jgi:hypothetical protein